MLQKKYNIFLYLLLPLMTFVFSAQILLAHQLDSLIKANNHYHKVDTIKINLLIHIGNK